MKKALLILMALFLCGCTIKRGKDELNLLRINTEKNHASIERVEGIGSKLTVVSESGFPEWWLGKMAHTQVFLPKLRCTTYYDEGVISKTVCDEIAPIGVESILDARGGHVGDQIVSGSATGYGSAFADSDSSLMWIEAMKSSVEKSDATEETKQGLIDALKEIGVLLAP